MYRTLFEIFDLIMRFNIHSPSGFQEKIRSHKLRPSDIELGLQNKCLNAFSLYDPNVSGGLVVIGGQLFEKAKQIDQTIERLFDFNEHLTAGEILLLERISARLHFYDLKDFDRPASRCIGDIQYAPVNPSLWYMKDNFAHLYGSFRELAALAFNNKYGDRELLLDKIQYYYGQGAYRRCKRSIRAARGKLLDDEMLLEFYVFLCEYMSCKRAAAYRRLGRILEAKPDLVSSRGVLAHLMTDNRIRDIVARQYDEGEIKKLASIVDEESKINEDFLTQAGKLKKYYEDKANSLSRKRDA